MQPETSSTPSPPSSRTSFVAIFDLRVAADGNELRHSLRQAYRASRSGLVGLVLGEHEPGEIDQLLDPVVEEVGSDVSGVVYLEDGPEDVGF